MAPDPDDLDELRERLRATAEAAERIKGKVPPQGWATPQDRDAAAGEVQALIAMLQALRDLVPEELWDQIREILRQLLLLLRAILDLVVERLGADGGARADSRRGPQVEDIPIT